MKIIHLSESNKKLEQNEFNKLIKGDYSQAFEQYKKGNIIYKGMKDTDSDIPMLMEPIKNRESKNTKNFYTLWINNHDNWKEFPNRNVICTTDRNVARGYGERYIIFPKNNSLIGIVPGFDIWERFEFDYQDVDSVFDGLNEIFQNLVDEKLTNISSYKNLISLIQMFDNQDKNKKLELLEEIYFSNSELQYIINYGLYEFLRTQFGPEEFDLVSISNYDKTNYPNNECWFDNTFIAIPESYLENL